MKKVILTIVMIALNVIAMGQVLSNVQLGIKGGANFSEFNKLRAFRSDISVGYYAGLWTRANVFGLYFQPEVYFSRKNTTLIFLEQIGPAATAQNSSKAWKNKVNFTSLDVPILIGKKINGENYDFRINTGPVFSFIFNNKQSIYTPTSFGGSFKNRAYAWQIGGGVDVERIGFDLRYETAIADLGEARYKGQKLSVFTLGLNYRM